MKRLTAAFILFSMLLVVTSCASKQGDTPNGGISERIAFASARDGNADIYIVDVDGGNLKKLSKTFLGASSPTWSPDGSKIVFITSVKGGSAEIRIMNADGSQQKPIFDNGGYFSDLVWSPNGKIIAINTPSEEFEDPKIAFINPNGDEIEVPKSVNLQGRSISWSPDSKKIVFSSKTDILQNEIFVFDFDDGSLTQITHTADKFLTNYSPVWSTDGGHIAFVRSDPSDIQTYDAEIIVIEPDGSNPMRLTNQADKAYPIAWSPDGAKIAFHFHHNIFVMNSDGSNRTQLTDSGWDGGSVWSPDSSKIAFLSRRDANWHIYVINVDGSNLIRLTDNEASDYAPAWQPVP